MCFVRINEEMVIHSNDYLKLIYKKFGTIDYFDVSVLEFYLLFGNNRIMTCLTEVTG